MFFCFKQKTAYEMRISDWSSDVCSSDLCQVSLEALSAAELRGALAAPALAPNAPCRLGAIAVPTPALPWHMAQRAAKVLLPATASPDDLAAGGAAMAPVAAAAMNIAPRAPVVAFIVILISSRQRPEERRV